MEATNEASFADLFQILTPQLFASSDHEDAVLLWPKTSFRARAVRAQNPREPVVIQIGNLKLDPERRLFWRIDKEIHLSPKEFDLLALLMKNSGVTVTHVKLLRSVWGLEHGGELEYLRTYVRTLRKKIEKVPAKPEYIVNEPWIGYRFRNPWIRSHFRFRRRSQCFQLVLCGDKVNHEHHGVSSRKSRPAQALDGHLLRLHLCPSPLEKPD